MKAKVFFKLCILSSLLLMGGTNLFANSENNLIYNSEEVNGVMVGETVYKMDGGTLSNYMQYNYKYDDQQRKVESEALKWNATRGEWTKDMCIRYAYEGNMVTTTYYKWNNRKGTYVLVPEMTVTMEASK